jgi:outer membrane protein with beta-barrel domain
MRSRVRVIRLGARVRGILVAALAVAVLAFPERDLHAAPPAVGAQIGLDLARLSFANLPNGIEGGFRTGFVVAGRVAFPLLPYLSLETGLDVATQGTELDGSVQLGTTTLEDGRIRLTYLHLPLLARISVSAGPVRPYVKFGPKLGLLLAAKAEAHSTGSVGDFETDIKDSASDFDVALQFAGGLEFPVATFHGLFEVGYGLGLVDVFDDPELPDSWSAKNQVVGITLGLLY